MVRRKNAGSRRLIAGLAEPEHVARINHSPQTPFLFSVKHRPVYGKYFEKKLLILVRGYPEIHVRPTDDTFFHLFRQKKSERSV